MPYLSGPTSHNTSPCPKKRERRPTTHPHAAPRNAGTRRAVRPWGSSTRQGHQRLSWMAIPPAYHRSAVDWLLCVDASAYDCAIAVALAYLTIVVCYLMKHMCNGNYMYYYEHNAWSLGSSILHRRPARPKGLSKIRRSHCAIWSISMLFSSFPLLMAKTCSRNDSEPHAKGLSSLSSLSGLSGLSGLPGLSGLSGKATQPAESTPGRG